MSSDATPSVTPMTTALPAAVRRVDLPIGAHSPRSAVSSVLLETPLLVVGRWRCPVDNPYFRDSGPPRYDLCVFPRTGVWIRHAGHRAFVADPSVVTYYNSGQPYERRAIDPAGDRCEWFGVARPVLEELLGRVDESGRSIDDVFSFTHGPCDRQSYFAQRAVFEHICHAEAPDALFVEESMLHVLQRTLTLARGQHTPQPRPPRRRHTRRTGAELAEAARAALARGFAGAWSLADLAARLGTSPFHLARVFRRHTGWSLHAYRTELRLRTALEGLEDPRADLAELALALGFSSHSHFTETFRKSYGLPPSIAQQRLGLRRGRARPRYFKRR